jgi:hypothetical protein
MELDAKKLFLFGGVVGLMLESITTGAIFVEPVILGINWLAVVLLFLIWGSAVMLPFYVLENVKKIKENIIINSVIVLYLLVEFVIGSQGLYTDVMFLTTGAILGVVTLIRIKQVKIKI